MVKANKNIEVNVDGKTTKTESNIIPYHNMAVVSRKIITNLLVKVVDTDLLDLEEGRRPLTPAFKYQIDLLWNPCLPSITNTIKEGLRNKAANILGFSRA